MPTVGRLFPQPSEGKKKKKNRSDTACEPRGRAERKRGGEALVSVLVSVEVVVVVGGEGGGRCNSLKTFLKCFTAVPRTTERRFFFLSASLWVIVLFLDLEFLAKREQR